MSFSISQIINDKINVSNVNNIVEESIQFTAPSKTIVSNVISSDLTDFTSYVVRIISVGLFKEFNCNIQIVERDKNNIQLNEERYSFETKNSYYLNLDVNSNKIQINFTNMLDTEQIFKIYVIKKRG